MVERWLLVNSGERGDFLLLRPAPGNRRSSYITLPNLPRAVPPEGKAAEWKNATIGLPAAHQTRRREQWSRQNRRRRSAAAPWGKTPSAGFGAVKGDCDAYNGRSLANEPIVQVDPRQERWCACGNQSMATVPGGIRASLRAAPPVAIIGAARIAKPVDRRLDFREIPDEVLPLLPIEAADFSQSPGWGTAITAVRVLSALLAVRRRALFGISRRIRQRCLR
jgi:hypothetical protein